MAQYYVPQGYVPAYDYPTSTSTSPSPDDGNDYYPPPQFRMATPHQRSKSRNHVRTGSYQSPRVAAPWSAPVYSPGHHAASQYYSSPPVARYEYVSTKDFNSRSRRNTASGHRDGGNGDIYADGKAKRRTSVRSPNQPVYVDVVEEGYDSAYDSREPVYTYIEPRATPKRNSSTKKRTPQKADNYFFYTQTQTTYESPDTPSRSRARRSSTNTRPKVAPSKPAKPVKPAPVATAADAAEHHIPAGYSLKNWDPTEEPILLLGSVFDANSLGKWIYDWTVYHHKAGSPMAEVAGELWLLLIKFAGKMKRAEECIPRIRDRENRAMVRDFYASGERIWRKMKDLIKLCEEFMWHAAKKDGAKGKVQMGEKSGIEFVKSIFGRERDLERTERLMTSIRLWNMRFDVNCEDILRRPSVA